MNSIRVFSIAIFFFFIQMSAQSQHMEVGVLLGGSNYFGDLTNNSSSFYIGETGVALGVFGRYNFSEYGAVRLGFNYANVSGNDQNSNDEAVQARNLDFRSSLMELHLVSEFNITGFQPYALYKVFSPYIFAGITATRFNPQTDFGDQTVDLRDVGTEGQNVAGVGTDESYGDILISIPFGIGIKYALTDKINLGLEIGARRTFTDYLDDVSGLYVSNQLAEAGDITAAALNNRSELNIPDGTLRGDDNGADWYFITGITISYNFIDNGLMGGRRNKRSRKGCKTGF